jgi:hypothetical protein
MIAEHLPGKLLTRATTHYWHEAMLLLNAICSAKILIHQEQTKRYMLQAVYWQRFSHHQGKSGTGQLAGHAASKN